MAKPSNAIIGRTRGSVGNVTFTVWKGINVLKEKAQNAYSDPTPAQLANNEKFGLMVAFFRTFMMYIQAGFSASAVGITVYNAFMRANPYSSVVTGSPGSYKVNTDALVLSKGSETPLALLTVDTAGANQVDFSYEFPADSTLPDTTQVFVLLFNKTTGALIASRSDLTKAETGGSFMDTGTIANATNVSLYAFYVNGENGKSSDSVLGTII